MRVISGSARRIQLTTPEGLNTRPTTDRIKETLFNMIQNYLADARFLDLFSGSGAIGIEAISRGANEAVFVENNREALHAIEKNLEKTGFKEQANILSMDYLGALKVLDGRRDAFDVIFMDPPYNLDFEKKVLEYLVASTILRKDTLIIFEASLQTEISFVEALGYEIYKIKEYKTNQHIFLKWKGTL
ncbi:MAG: 16S rRNA (guanine(966)-N(2))-methyltransferase RsmD [Velocimicrobium sp.]